MNTFYFKNIFWKIYFECLDLYLYNDNAMFSCVFVSDLLRSFFHALYLTFTNESSLVCAIDVIGRLLYLAFCFFTCEWKYMLVVYD